MSTVHDLDKIYDVIEKLCWEAGKIIKEAKITKVETKKAEWDVVTEFDRKVENYLIENLHKEFPGHKFIAEESAATNNTKPELTDDPTWIIDPIDGTMNFVRGVPFCAISVALTINKQLEIGIVYGPYMNQFFSARKGKGAYLNGEKIFCSKKEELKSSLVSYEASLIRGGGKLMNRLKMIASNSMGIRSFGCAALSLCYVANGSNDVYQIDYLQPWDVAAGALIVREAGGFIKNSNGGEFNVMKPNFIAAGTEKLIQEVLELFEKC